MFGQTECNLVIGSNSKLFPIRPGSMGKATPGFDVRIVNDKGKELPRGARGIIGVRQPNPCTMLEYWRNPEGTAKKYAGEFLLTGDLGIQDEDGYFWYVSREDDVITTAGYRVGPSEIEHTLMKHPAVAMSAVVGIPDPIRTELIKAWIATCARALSPARRWRERSRISSRCNSPPTNIRASCNSPTPCR